MKRVFTFLMLMAMFAPLAMQADEVTICDGTNSNSYVPMYTYYCDYGFKSEYIIPQSQLSNLPSGSEITAITLYQNSSAAWVAKNLTIKLSNTTTTSYSSTGLLGSSGTTVYTNSSYSANSASSHTFTFNGDSFTYTGGSLIVQISAASGGTYKSSTWYGVTQSTNQGYYVYGSSSSGGSLQTFIPKTKFTYTPASNDPWISLSPSSATVLTGLTQTLTATTYNVTGTPTISYSSSNTNVATVSGNGTTATVTGVAPGTATITATMTYESNTYTAQCAITVEDPSYCEPSFSNPSDDYISNFTTTGGTTNINNSSNYVTGGYSNYYNDYSASIDAGGTLSCTVTPSSTQWSYGHAIWVDWNKDYEFSSDERVAYTTSTATGNWTGSVVVPADAAGGDYRLRVIHLYNNTPTDACMSGQYGEAEDYKLTVIAASNCPTPTITDITATANSATISTDSEASSFNVRYREYTASTSYDFEDGWQGWTAVQGTDGTSPHNWMHNTEYTAYSSNGNVIDLTTSGYNSSTGFMLSESYISAPTSGGTATGAVYPDNYLISPQVRLGGSMTFYAAGRTTDYAEKFTVMVSTTGTNISDFVATSFTVTLSSQTYTQYTVDLSAYSGMGYVIFHHYDCTDQHMLRIDDVTIVAPSIPWQTGNDLTITGLEPATTYEVQVQANCGDEDGLSAWSAVATFTTLEVPPVPVTSIEAPDVNLIVGETATITPTVLPADATNPAVTFSSADETVATVNDNGDVTGVAAGTTTITIAATDGSGVTGTLTVTVTNIDVEEITAEDITMITGETATISYTVLPANATDASVTFTSANTAIATVDADGVVTGVSAGETTITIASVQNPEVITTITVTVTPNPYAVQFTVNAPAMAAPGDVITVEAVLAAPEEGDYEGFNGLLLGLYYDNTAFQYVSGSITQGAVAQNAAQIDENTLIQTYTNVAGVIQMAIAVPTEGTFVTTEGVVFSAQFTVLEDTEGSFTFTAQPNNYQNFNHEAEYITYEATPSTVEVHETFTLTITGYGNDNNPGGYFLIASPIGTVAPAAVDNMIITNEQGQPITGFDLFYFDHAQELEWINYKPGTDSNDALFNLEPGKGYLYARKETADLVFHGQAYSTEDMEMQITLDRQEQPETGSYNIDLPGWNLVGNPFAETAYIDMVSEERPFYTMNETGAAFISCTNQSIQPMEGIFVIAEENGETMTFTTTQPTKQGKGLALNLSDGQNVIDRAIVRFNKGRQLPKLQFRKGSTKVYIPMDGQDYAVVRAEEMGEMPVNFKAENNGTYTLNLSSENVEFAYLHLIDNMTGADVDLLETPSYSFEACATDYESRFKLVFATGDNSNSDNFAFFSNGSFVINNEGAATLQVIDVTGRILSSESINGCANVNVNGAAGVYMLRLINGDNVKIQKVVVK